MAHKKKESLTAITESFLKELVRSIFDEMLVKAGPDSVPHPDAVMEELPKRFAFLVGPSKKKGGKPDNVSQIRVDTARAQRNAHHYAVDLFYDSLVARRRGAPAYRAEDNARLVDLHSRGYSYAQIAKMLKLPTSPPSERIKSIDQIRKRIKRAGKKTASPLSHDSNGK